MSQFLHFQVTASYEIAAFMNIILKWASYSIWQARYEEFQHSYPSLELRVYRALLSSLDHLVYKNTLRKYLFSSECVVTVTQFWWLYFFWWHPPLAPNNNTCSWQNIDWNIVVCVTLFMEANKSSTVSSSLFAKYNFAFMWNIIFWVWVWTTHTLLLK